VIGFRGIYFGKIAKHVCGEKHVPKESEAGDFRCGEEHVPKESEAGDFRCGVQTATKFETLQHLRGPY
jgi:hypothetical protein